MTNQTMSLVVSVAYAEAQEVEKILATFAPRVAYKKLPRTRLQRLLGLNVSFQLTGASEYVQAAEAEITQTLLEFRAW
jgi:hypothetical protein